MSSSFTPRVSIIIPVYNGDPYLREAIDCALAQTYENLEVIVVNDGSRDDGATEAIALSYGDKIRYIKKENGGVSSALNLGIQTMTGDYFSWLSHDDRYDPEKVATSISYLAQFPERERLLVMCGGYYIDKHANHLRDMHFDFERDTVYGGADVVEYLLKRSILDACCLLIPKTAFDECGLFHEDLRYNQDALMWFEIFCHGYGLVVCDDQKLVAYRLHATQTSKTRRDLLLSNSEMLARIIAPTFASLTTPSHKLLHLFVRFNARFYCVAAVNECVRVGRETGVFRKIDAFYARLWLLYGKCRNLLKAVYHRLRFHK